MWIFYTPKQNRGEICASSTQGQCFGSWGNETSFLQLGNMVLYFLFICLPGALNYKYLNFLFSKIFFFFSLAMKWTGSCGVIYFTFHHKSDYFLSHITAIPLSTLVAESQIPLHSAQCTQKQFSLKTEVSLLWKFSPNLQKNNNPCLGGSIRAAWKPHLGYYTSNRVEGSVSTAHSGRDFTWLVPEKIRDALASDPPGEERLVLGLFHRLVLACPLSEQDGTK